MLQRVGAWLIPAAAMGIGAACGSEAEPPAGYTPVSTAEGGFGGVSGNAGSTGGNSHQGGAQSTGGTGAVGGASGSGETGGTGASGSGGSMAGAAGQSGTSGAGGASGFGGAIGGSAGTSGASGTGGCEDSDQEPNNDESTAQSLGSITDCDSDGASLTGVIDGQADQDFYTLHGSDTFGCVVDPNIMVTTNDPLKLCIYFHCDSGTANVSCYGASQAATSALGHAGCCTTALSISPGVACGGSNDDSTTVWIQVSAATDQCISYTIDYHY